MLSITNWINFSRNYCSHYDKTSENCGPLRLEENARKHTANQRKTCLHSPYSSNTAANDVRSFRSLQRFLAEKMLNDIEELKTCLNHCFALSLFCFFIIPIRTYINSGRKILGNQIWHQPLTLSHVQNIWVFIWVLFWFMLSGPT